MIKNIVKGMIIGIANIIPGVSGGTMAVSMGIYDKLIHALTHLHREFKESLKLIIPILIGAALAIVGLSFVIEFLFHNYPLETNFLFIGLIVGGLPAILKKVKGKKASVGNILALLAFFALVVGFAVVGETEGSAADLSLNALNIVKLFGVGIIASATMVIPGVSGSMILLLIGYYNPIIETINSFIKALAAVDVNGMLHYGGILVPFGLGVVIGIFAIAKLIEIIFEKCPMLAYYAIIGLILASPVGILLMSGIKGFSLMSVIVSVGTFLIGSFVAYRLGE